MKMKAFVADAGRGPKSTPEKAGTFGARLSPEAKSEHEPIATFLMTSEDLEEKRILFRGSRRVVRKRSLSGS